MKGPTLVLALATLALAVGLGASLCLSQESQDIVRLSDQAMSAVSGMCAGGTSTTGAEACIKDKNDQCTCNPLYVLGKLVGVNDNCDFYSGRCAPETETLCTGGCTGNCKVTYPDCEGTYEYYTCTFVLWRCILFHCATTPTTDLACPGTRKTAVNDC